MGPMDRFGIIYSFIDIAVVLTGDARSANLDERERISVNLNELR